MGRADSAISSILHEPTQGRSSKRTRKLQDGLSDASCTNPTTSNQSQLVFNTVDRECNLLSQQGNDAKSDIQQLPRRSVASHTEPSIPADLEEVDSYATSNTETNEDLFTRFKPAASHPAKAIFAASLQKSPYRMPKATNEHPGSPGILSAYSIFQDYISLYGEHSELRKRLLFTTADASRPTVSAIALRHHLTWAEDLRPSTNGHKRISRHSNRRLFFGPRDMASLIAHEALACALFARKKAYVLVTSEQDAKRRDTLWNAYIRPTLQGRRVEITWFNEYGGRREAVYPDGMLPPHEFGLPPFRQPATPSEIPFPPLSP